MNQYLKIPRGININAINDLLLKKAIEEIGKRYSRVLFGRYRSNYAKGKAYLSKEYGLSKTAIKKLHSVKISTRGYERYGNDYSNYVCVHILLAKIILEEIIKTHKEQKIAFVDVAGSISKRKYNSECKYIDVLFEETLHWMKQGLLSSDNFCSFNNNTDAICELNALYNSINSIDETIGG